MIICTGNSGGIFSHIGIFGDHFFKQPEIERKEEGECCDLRLGGRVGRCSCLIRKDCKNIKK